MPIHTHESRAHIRHVPHPSWLSAARVLGTLALSLFAAVSGSGFLTWGWRVPFLLSAVLIAVGLVIRLKVSETPSFRRLEAAGEKRRIPLLDVLRSSPRALVLGLVATTAFYVCQAMTTVWGVSLAVGSGADKNGVLNIKAAAAVLTLVICFYSARLSDRIGRRTVLGGATVLGMVLAYPIIVLMANGRIVTDGSATEVKSMVDLRTIRATLPGVSEGDLLRLPGVVSVERRGNSVLLRCRDSDTALRALLGCYRAARHLEVSAAGLDEAFLRLTRAAHAGPTSHSAHDEFAEIEGATA